MLMGGTWASPQMEPQDVSAEEEETSGSAPTSKPERRGGKEGIDPPLCAPQEMERG